ncbi:MAG: serine/threonine protein kinase [Planctomycetales bacterium]|nr:serine/threonine protein kinase [Planctomycetales bacterium]
MTTMPLTQEKVDQIAEEFSAAIRSGLAPSIADYLQMYPDESGQLARLLESISMIEGMKQQFEMGKDETTSPAIDALDDYQIVREIGRGGMGIVFEALHQSLGRRVAIKVLAESLLERHQQLSRFRQEARAAARLRHSNIVPVYGVGHANGYHYYVMDYVNGCSMAAWLGNARTDYANENTHTLASRGRTARTTSLDATIDTLQVGGNYSTTCWANLKGGNDKRPSFLNLGASKDGCRWIARKGATICDALEYAHTQGVLHRDIKPANILVDQANEVWLADFGLAKLFGQGELTKSGDIIGTPQYMPPESFNGKYDARSEVFAVGLTLFEMLTGRPVNSGRSASEIIRQALLCDIPRPTKLTPTIPADLETIVLKALCKEPEGRYQSAGEMRDDLLRYCDGRAIQARRLSSMERLLRWTKREPLVSSLTAASFLLLVALSLVSGYGYFHVRLALDQVEQSKRKIEDALSKQTAALAAAEHERLRAENNLQVALKSFDHIMQNISDRGIEIEDEVLGEATDTVAAKVTQEDAALLESLLGFFDELSTNNSESLLEESALAAHRAGDIYASLGRLKQAEKAYSEAKLRYAKLNKQFTAVDDHDANAGHYLVAQAQVMNELSAVSSLRGQLYLASSLFEETCELFEAHVVRIDDAAKYELARAYRLFASSGTRSGLDGLTHKGPLERPVRTLPPAPQLMMLKQRSQRERDAVETGIALLQELVAADQNNLQYQAELARALRCKAIVLTRNRRRSEAEEAFKQSIAILENLLQDNRRSDSIRYELAMTLVSSEAAGLSRAFRANRAYDLSNQLLAASPTVPRYRALKALALEDLAYSSRMSRTEQTMDLLDEAVAIYEQLMLESPELIFYETRRAQLLEMLADVLAEKGETDQAVVKLRQGIEGLQQRQQRLETSSVSRLQLLSMRQKMRQLTLPPKPSLQ